MPIFETRRCRPVAMLVAVLLAVSMLYGEVAAQGEPARLSITSAPSSTLLGGVDRGVSPVRLRTRFLMEAGQRTGILQVEARLASGFHIGSVTQLAGGPQPSVINFQPSAEFQILAPFQPDSPPTVVPPDAFPVPEEYHAETVVWSAPIVLGDGVDPNALLIQGYLSGQVCDEAGACSLLSPNLTAFTARFDGVLSSPAPPPSRLAVPTQDVAPIQTFTPIVTGQTPVIRTSAEESLSPGAYPSTGRADLRLANGSSASTAMATVGSTATNLLGQTSVVPLTTEPGGLVTTLKYFGLAFVAGFILNFMPCVLPVIGLKVMSFVKQAGESRGRVLTLNVFFVLGMMTVFMLLACLTAFLGYGWGALFQLPEFSIAMVCIVFVFALSMMGVWELPSPSFAGRGKAVEIAEREGASGAYFKGILTTLLATPCTGPLLGTALGWAVKQPRPVIFGSFACMGLGMGIPYILFGLSPRLMSLLPKPGAWMDTFKQVMGFVLLATVVWLFYGMSSAHVVPTIALIFTLWAACWAIGRVPITASLQTKSVNYLGALAFAAIVGYFSFTSLFSESNLAEYGSNDGGWPRYTERADLDEFRDKGIPVFMDFTAKW